MGNGSDDRVLRYARRPSRGPAPADDAGVPTMIALERRDGRPLVIGHRGAADLAPENTLRGLRAGLAAGVDLIEFDVLALASGELVLAHSDDLYEVTHGTARGRVRDLSLAGLRELAPELPTLDDALRFFAEDARQVGVHVD